LFCDEAAIDICVAASVLTSLINIPPMSSFLANAVINLYHHFIIVFNKIKRIILLILYNPCMFLEVKYKDLSY
jgi:hypothetical protein